MHQPNFDTLYHDVPPAQKTMLRRFRANYPYRMLPVNGIIWHYLTAGQGAATVVLLPGAFMCADMWMHVIIALENDYSIIAPDAYALHNVYDLKTACDALAHILDAEGVHQAILVGLSAGGGWAQYMIQWYPERVAHVVLSHCGAINRDPDEVSSQRILFTMLRVMPRGLLKWMLLKRIRGEYPEHAPWVDYARAFVHESTLRIRRDMLIGFFSGGMQMLKNYPYQSDVFANWPGEALLLASQDDAVGYKHLEDLQGEFPRAQVAVLPEGGHHTFLLFPGMYAQAVVDFVTALPVPQPV